MNTMAPTVTNYKRTGLTGDIVFGAGQGSRLRICRNDNVRYAEESVIFKRVLHGLLTLGPKLYFLKN